MYEEYSLESHLKEICKDKSQYSHLSASLELDKIEVKKMLAEIVYNTPHYSNHEVSHSESILQKIEMLLGVERIKRLEPTETWLIIMAAYTHDLGMIIFNEKLKKNWAEKEFQDFINENAENSSDEDLKKSCEIIKNIDKDYVDSNLYWALDVKNAVNIITSEYFRGKHSDESQNMILEANLENYTDIFLTSSINVNSRIIKLLSKINLSHSKNYSELLEMFQYESNGCATDKIHPRFIASLLRLGDVLDLDNNRFNKYNEALIGKLPKISMIHKDKHEAITHFLITPQNIEVHGDCKDSKVYRELRRWLDMLENEVKELSINWNIVAPKDFGTAPKVNEIILKIKGSEEFINQANLKFHIDNKKAFEVIEGSGIYENNMIFIRELIQNAIDTTKIQIWKDLKDEKYNGYFEDTNNIEQELKKIKLSPHNLDERILKNYPIIIKMDIKEKENDYNLMFEISDKGTGISNLDLLRICDVGSSYKINKDLVELIEDLPFYLKPTAAFGLGLQSCFISSDKVDIHTKSDGEKVKHIELESGKRGYVTVENSKKNIKKGSTFIVKVNKKEIEKLSLENVNYDEFTEENIYIKFLKDYIIKMISNIKLLYFQVYFDNEETKVEYKNPFREIKDKDKIEIIKVNEDLYIDVSKKIPLFYIIERENGAFVKFEPVEYEKRRFKKFYVRGMRVDRDRDKNRSYNINFNIEIDILSEKSDKLLSMSRDKPKNEKEFYSLVDKIYYNSKKILFNGIKNMEKEKKQKFISKSKNEKINFILNYENMIFYKDEGKKIFENYESEIEIKVIEKEKEEIKDYSIIFDLDIFIILSGNKSLNENFNKKRNEYLKNIKNKYKNKKIGINNLNYEDRYIEVFFQKVEEMTSIFNIEVFEKTTSKKEKKYYEIYINRIRKINMRRIDILNYSYRWKQIIGNEEKEEINILKVQDERCNKLIWNDEGKYSYIYSPFFAVFKDKNKTWNDELLLKEIKEKKHELIELERKERIEKMENIILDNIDTIISEKLISHIMKYSISKEKSEEEIKKQYSKIIKEYYTKYNKELYLESEYFEVNLDKKKMKLKSPNVWELIDRMNTKNKLVLEDEHGDKIDYKEDESLKNEEKVKIGKFEFNDIKNELKFIEKNKDVLFEE